MQDAVEQVAERAGPLERALKNILARAASKRSGKSFEEALAAVEEVASERPILDWLKNGGFELILKIILGLLL